MPFKIYRSSAGSGKTFTLVKEYLRIALSTNKPDNYRGILAVTFTNKAAEEMKSRVIESLKLLGNETVDNDPMIDLLTAELDCTRSVIAQRAKLTLKHMLHHYSDVSISTIDRFSHRLIRTFAQDLGLSINFEVELDTVNLEHGVIHELMKRVGSDTILTEILLDLIQSTIEDEKGWNIDERITKFVNVLFSEESRFHLEHLKKIDLKQFSVLRKSLKIKIRTAQAELEQLGTTSVTSALNKDLTPQSFAGGANGIFGFFKKLSQGKFEMPNATVIKNINNDKWYGGKAKVSDKAAIDELKPALEKDYQKSVELIKTLTYHQVIFSHIYGVALLDEMQRVLSNIQTENELLHIGEFNHLINNVVMTETAPFIYERIGARYHHFLIDEFQDTNILQWFNLLPLVDESLAHDNLCLVVGDAKQSIYRWRGGDVQQFIELPAIHKPAYVAENINSQPHLKRLFDVREQTLKAAEDTQTLDSNYRSKSTIVEFNNLLFESLQKRMPPKFASMYEASYQHPVKTEKGLVTVQMLRQEGGGKSWPEYDKLVLEQTVKWIDECLEDDYAPGDIAIIFRANNDAIKTALFLVEKGYSVVSNESLLINSSVRVRLLINIVVFLYNPKNGTNVAELIQHIGETTNDSTQTSERLMNTKGATNTGYVNELLQKLYPTIEWNDLLQETPFSLFSTLIYGLFENVVDPHLSFFLNEVLAFGQSKRRSLTDFLEYWFEKREKLSIALEENSKAIRIITIHKSKGLEFPVVIHPFTDYKDSSGKNSIWVYTNDEEMEPLDRIRVSSSKALLDTPFSEAHELENSLEAMDMFNQLYVATTRAKDRLYLSGKLKKNSSDDSKPSTAIQYIRTYLLSSGCINSEQLNYQCGERIKFISSRTEVKSLALQKVGDPFWKNRVSIAQPISIATNSSGTANARLHGIAVHDALSLIKTEKDIDKAVQKLVEEGRISQFEIEDLTSHIHNLISRTELKHLFSGDKLVRNEADIQLSNGRWLRPDRVVTQGNKAWVIDYKTGEERREHHKQISDYKNAMSDLGYEQVEGMLVYLETENVVQVQ